MRNFYREEKNTFKRLRKYFKINVHSKKLNLKFLYWEKSIKIEDYRSDNTEQLNVDQTINLLKKAEYYN